MPTTQQDTRLPDERVRILLIGDRSDDLDRIRSAVNGECNDLLEAHSRKEAIERVQTDEFAVILLAIQGAATDGFETADSIRRQDRASHTPILFISSDDVGKLAAKAYALTPADYLPRPISPEALRAKVAGFVKLFRRIRTARLEGAEKASRAADEARHSERRQREQLQVTLSSIGDGVIVTDADGVVTFLNSVAQTLTGWPPEEAAGQPLEKVFKIINEHTRKPAENPVAKALQEGVVVGLANHSVLIARDGTERPIDDSAAPIRGEDGAIGGVVLVFRDVTEARRALEARLRLAAIVESSEDAIISKTLDGIIVSWNEGAERLYGYTAQEMIGKPLAILIPSDSPNELPAIIERLKRGERIAHYETVRVCKDGTRLNVSLTISPVRNPEGEIIGASKVARDITAAKRTAEALRFLAEASSVLAEVEDVPSTLHKIARLSVPRFADWCAVDLLGEDGSLRRLAVAHVDPAKVQLARDLQRRYPPQPDASQGVWNVLRSGHAEIISEITDAMLAATIKDPERLQAALRLGIKSYMAVPLRVKEQTVGVITFASAESARRYGPSDLTVAEDLARRAGVAIENAQLYGELRKADRLKDEFLAMLAHELRNPLGPIRNALVVMKQPHATPAIIEQVRGMAERQAQHMTRLLDDLLDMSRISHGRIELRKEVAELAPIVHRTIEAVRPLIEERRHQLVLSLPVAPLWMEVDPHRLEQVLSNLLNNAAKYTDPGGRIELSAAQDGVEIVLRVRDTGIGIAPQMLPTIFDLFVQAERRLDRSQGGVGIGLTLVKRLVEMHGGKVEVASPGMGRGSEFSVRLPGVAQSEGSAQTTRIDVMADGALPTRRILVVDDNEDAAETLAALLRLKSQKVEVAHGGPAALEAVRRFEPEMIFLDIGMPGMDGYEVARKLRARSDHRNLILIALTGFGQEDDRARSRAAGFDHHLVKPIGPISLQAILQGDRLHVSEK
jgi:PAS domain S-box-containing protein